MQLITFYDASSRYVADAIDNSLSHISLLTAEVNKAIVTENFAQFKDGNFDAFLLAIGDNRTLEIVLAAIRKFEIDKPIFIVKLSTLSKKLPFMDDDIFLRNRVELISQSVEDKLYLVHVETHICDHCNLNCKACNNYSPFVRKRSPASLEQWSSDIKRLSGIYRIGRIFLLGGEPLTEPQLTEEFIKVTRYFAPHSEIVLLTNGLLIPNMTSDFWEVLNNNNVTLKITAYIPTIAIMPTILATLKNHDANYHCHKALTFGKRLTLTGDKDAAFNNICCNSSGCHYMRDGYLYKCPDAGLIKHLDAVAGTNLQSKCGISLDEAEKNPAAVLDRLIEPIDLCHYCDNKNGKAINWQPVQGQPDINDWLL